MKGKAIFIAATGQHVGKTTLCLGLIAALKKRFQSTGFIKPVGQQHINVEKGINVDKDVFLFKHHFSLTDAWEDMSPVIIPSGMTRDYLDGKVCDSSMIAKIKNSFNKISEHYQYTVVEGTGHVGVGSIVNISNATVARELGLEIVIIASGGLGSAYDELELNISMCQQQNVPIRGVILNRVIKSKREMILNYFPKCLKKWGIPLIGALPYSEFLSQPTMQDFAHLFNTNLLSGAKQRYRHFCHSRLVADSLEAYKNEMIYNELVITPACREEIIAANIDKHQEVAKSEGTDFAGGMILTGYRPPSKELLERIQLSEIPVLYVPLYSYEAMQRITSFTSKIRKDDILKINKAISLVENHLNFNMLL